MPDDSRLVTCDRCAFPTPSDRSNCQGCGAPLPEHLRTAVPKGEAPRAAGPATRWAGIQGERVEVRAPTRIVRERRFMSAEAPAAPAPPAPASPAPAPPVPGPAPKLPEELVGAVVDGHYRIVAKLGEGGMGVVFDAFDLNLERRVAMKVIQANLRENPSFVERFRREAKIVAQLKHPNLLECYDFGVDETLGALYMILPLLEGTSLDKVLKDGGALAPARAIGIARQMLGALECAHERCIIHRDIKPANIFLEQTANGEQVKLLDFGLAHDEIASMFAKSGAALTNTGTLLGTPAYMSPEQIAGKGITALSDVYAAGCVVYEMLTGRPVFGGESIGDIVAKQLRDAPPVDPLRDQLIPGEIERVVLKALAKKPADRHASARSFCSALEEAARYEPTMSLPPPPAVVAPAAPPSPAPALPRPAPPPSRRVAPPARAIAPSEPAPPQGPLTTGEWVGMLDLAAPAVPAPPPVAPTPRAEPAQTPPRAPLPAAPPPSSGRHPAIELDGRRSPTASGASTQRFSTSEILRVPRVAPTARAPQTGPGARDEDVVAWLSCAPLPPFALGASPVVKIGRSRSCDLVLPHPGVSRVHAVITVSGTKLVLEDRSTHGSYVNGHRVTTAQVAPSDNVVIGPYEIKVCSKNAPLQAAASEDDTKAFVRSVAGAQESAMSGELEPQRTAEVLRDLELNARSGTLSMQSGEIAGELVVLDGLPMRASLGPLLGEVAVHAMLTLKRGSYSFQTTVKAGDRNVSKKLTAIVLDASRDQDDD